MISAQMAAELSKVNKEKIVSRLEREEKIRNKKREAQLLKKEKRLFKKRFSQIKRSASTCIKNAIKKGYCTAQFQVMYKVSDDMINALKTGPFNGYDANFRIVPYIDEKGQGRVITVIYINWLSIAEEDAEEVGEEDGE